MCRVLVQYTGYSLLTAFGFIRPNSCRFVISEQNFCFPSKINSVKLIWGLLIGRIIIKLQVTGHIAFVSNSGY